MVGIDELQEYICKKYGYDCKNCEACLYNEFGLREMCSFDTVNGCLLDIDIEEIKNGSK